MFDCVLTPFFRFVVMVTCAQKLSVESLSDASSHTSIDLSSLRGRSGRLDEGLEQVGGKKRDGVPVPVCL